MTKAREIIETQEFATLPAVASKVLSILEDEDVNIRSLSTLIETDPALTIKVLRVANSPLYATSSEVNSINQAIVNLGLNRLTNIVLGISIFSKFFINTNNELSAYINKFWWHSSSTGMIAKSLSTKLNKFFKEAEFIGGLIHDIGKLALLQYSLKDFREVLMLVESGNSDIEAENMVFGTNHNEIGAEIAKLWKLPKDLTQILQYHTNPQLANFNKELVALVRLADQFAEIWGADFYEGITELYVEETESWKILVAAYPELEDLDIEMFTFELENEFYKTTEFLKIVKE
ncbi:MAG TPA: HDOD domain-containing protein [Candidatus Kapabacteria bacterium]|nr:HDOD domain-containing protein [Candidatus Kapabacteria bacterium]